MILGGRYVDKRCGEDQGFNKHESWVLGAERKSFERLVKEVLEVSTRACFPINWEVDQNAKHTNWVAKLLVTSGMAVGKKMLAS